MKITRCLTMAVVLLGLTGVSRAISFRVLDPTGALPAAPNITQLGFPYNFSFYDDNGGCPGGASGCFDAVNNTGHLITSLSFTISTNTLLTPPPTSDTIDCPTTPYGGLSSFSNNVTCNASVSSTDDSFTVTFTGGAVQPFSSLWIVENGIPAADFGGPTTNDPNAPYPGTFTVDPTATPEPSSLWMAITGLAPLGYALRRRRGAVKA